MDLSKNNGRHNTQEANAVAARINTLEWTVVKECYQTNNISFGEPRSDCPMCPQFERT